MIDYEEFYNGILKVYDFSNRIKSLSANGIIDNIYGKENIINKVSVDIGKDKLFIFRTLKNFKPYTLHIKSGNIDILPLPYELSKEDDSIELFIDNIRGYLLLILECERYQKLESLMIIAAIVALLLHDITTLSRVDIIYYVLSRIINIKVSKSNIYGKIYTPQYFYNKEVIEEISDVLDNLLDKVEESNSLYILNEYIANSKYLLIIKDISLYNIIIGGEG